MEAETISHLLQRIALSPVKEEPYHHFHIGEIFPDAFYRELIDNLPDISYFRQSNGYAKRFYINLSEKELTDLPFAHFLFWVDFARGIRSDRLLQAVLEKFRPQLKERFGENFSIAKLELDVALLRDQSDYSLGPHTDHPNKIITLLFYLPASQDQEHLGTSLYIPKDRAFKCKGREHYSFEDFDRVHTVPFRPNSVFGFVRSDVSFHGVEPLGQQEKERILFSYTILESA